MAENSLRPSAVRRLRHRVGPWINQLTRALGQPTTRVYPEGYVGTVRRSIDDFEAELSDGGFEWDPLSMYHRTAAGSTTDGSWVYRPARLADRQLHVVLFARRRDQIDVYAHEEFSWLRHPVKHAREEDIRRNEGVAEMRRWLAARGIEYDRDSLVRRKVRHAVERVTDDGFY